MSTTEQVEVTIQYVNQPKPGKKFGNIKTAEQGTVFCLPGLLKEFSPNQIRNIVIQTDPPREQGGEPFRKVQSVMPINGAHRPAVANTRPRMDISDQRGAWITAICAGWAHSGQIAVDDGALLKARQKAGRAFDMDAVPDRQRRDDMNDELPNWSKPTSENPADGLEDVTFDR